MKGSLDRSRSDDINFLSLPNLLEPCSLPFKFRSNKTPHVASNGLSSFAFDLKTKAFGTSLIPSEITCLQQLHLRFGDIGSRSPQAWKERLTSYNSWARASICARWEHILSNLSNFDYSLNTPLNKVFAILG